MLYWSARKQCNAITDKGKKQRIMYIYIKTCKPKIVDLIQYRSHQSSFTLCIVDSSCLK